LTAISRTGSSAERLGYASLTAALCLSLWVAAGSLVQTVAGDLGPHPVRRVALGVALIGMLVLALWQRGRVVLGLRRTPELVVALSVAQLLAAVLDDPLGGPYLAVSLTSIGVAVVAARARTVWLCVIVLEAGYLLSVLLTATPAELSREAKLGGVIGGLLGPLFAALLLLALRLLLMRLALDPSRALHAVRGPAPGLTPSLRRAIQAGVRPRLLPRPAPRSPLTPTEILTVEGLARGRAPKQLAEERQVSLETVRSHIKSAKRKSGARTQRALAALPARSDWPYLDDRER